MVGCVSGCVGMAGCHTLLHLCKSVLSVGDPTLQEGSMNSVNSVGGKSQREGSVNSVNSVGGNHSEKAAWVWQGCHTLLHLYKSVLSVGENRSKKVLCRSVKSVGENHSKKVRVKSVGELFWLRGVYPPTEQTGRGCSPTDFTDSHRWCVFGIL